MELKEVGTIEAQVFKFDTDGVIVFMQCNGCSETLEVDNLDVAIKWADAHEIEKHTDPT